MFTEHANRNVIVGVDVDTTPNPLVAMGGPCLVINADFPSGPYRRGRRVGLLVSHLGSGATAEAAHDQLATAITAVSGFAGHRGAMWATWNPSTGTASWTWIADNIPLTPLLNAAHDAAQRFDPGDWAIRETHGAAAGDPCSSRLPEAVCAMSNLETGWHAFSPDDPDCPPQLRELANTTEPPVLGTVTITVHELVVGGSSVNVGGPGASTTQLIDAAIIELHETRRLLTD